VLIALYIERARAESLSRHNNIQPTDALPSTLVHVRVAGTLQWGDRGCLYGMIEAATQGIRHAHL
jgi:hypothetical protein